MTTLTELILSYPDLKAAAMDGQYEVVAKALNDQPLVDNPVGYSMVPKPFRMIDVFGALENGDRAKLLQAIPGWFIERVDRALAENDRESLGIHFAMMQGVLGATSRERLNALLKAKHKDPTWQAKVPGKSLAMSAGLPKVKPSDVQDVAQSL